MTRGHRQPGPAWSDTVPGGLLLRSAHDRCITSGEVAGPIPSCHRCGALGGDLYGLTSAYITTTDAERVAAWVCDRCFRR